MRLIFPQMTNLVRILDLPYNLRYPALPDEYCQRRVDVYLHSQLKRGKELITTHHAVAVGETVRFKFF